jgi:hypothetical protein
MESPQPEHWHQAAQMSHNPANLIVRGIRLACIRLYRGAEDSSKVYPRLILK